MFDNVVCPRHYLFLGVHYKTIAFFKKHDSTLIAIIKSAYIPYDIIFCWIPQQDSLVGCVAVLCLVISAAAKIACSYTSAVIDCRKSIIVADLLYSAPALPERLEAKFSDRGG